YLWERCRGIPFDAGADLPHFLPWARLGTLVFWWLLLFYGRKAGRSLAGPWGGRIAVALLACEPSLLAHASLATTDISVSACLLALVYHFRAGREAGGLRRGRWAAVWVGAAVLTRAAALRYGAMAVACLACGRLPRPG